MTTKNFINYHSHSSLSNLSTPDSTISNADRTLRAVELGQGVVSYVEHGSAISFLEGIPLSQKHGVKPLLGSEVYFVKDRHEKDNKNAHLILLARNENGRKSINRVISEANLTGFYYKPRVDFELVLSLPKNDIWVTTACLGGIWKYEDHDEIMMRLFEHFGKSNFFLEVQAHDADQQRALNKHVLDLSNHYGIGIMAGLDSHMIYPEQAKLRDDYLLSRGISYPDEENWYLDFCNYDTFYQRLFTQGILNRRQIDEALENTNIFQDVQPYNSPIFDRNLIKLPTLYPDKTQEQRDQILKELIWSRWEAEKSEVPESEWAHYEEEITKEYAVIVKTKTSDYFLLDHQVVQRGRDLGGSITLTGRGSAPSYFTSKLLGLTTVDRIAASVKLFPERFISAERLLEAKSLPDIDLNLGTPEIFAEAQRQVMGDGHSYPMVAFGTLKALGAWKLYARTADVPFDVANLISDQIRKYEFDTKHSDGDEDDEIDIHDYIDPHYHQVYEQSRKYLGLINSVTVHPCAYVLYSDGDIKEEFGLIKTKTGETEHICACCEGHFAEDYKLLKNDLLKVAVVDLIYKVYQRIGIKPHTLPELIKLCEGDDKVWDIYKNAWAVGINQFERPGTSGRGAKYAPKNISEISAFIAAIRPGFKSNYKQFEAREPFSYDVPTLDNLIQTKEFPYSYLLYQENAMQVLSFAGIPVSETYEIIKNIAKKRVEKVLKYKVQFIEGMRHKLMTDEHLTQERAEEVADMTWQIIEDSSRYSFNASHSYSYAGDSLYGAYLKANYPLEFYEVLLQMTESDGDKDRLAIAKIEAEKAFHISFPPYRFGQDNRSIVANGARHEITQSLRSIKGFGQAISEHLYELGQVTYKDFLEFLVAAEEQGYVSKKFEELIKINYFECFGHNQKLLMFFNEFNKGKSRYSRKLTEKSKVKRLPELQEMWEQMPNQRISVYHQVQAEEQLLGTIQSIFPSIDKRFVYVQDLNTKFSPRMLAYCLATGKTQSIKIQRRLFDGNPFEPFMILHCDHFEKKSGVIYKEGEYINNPDEEVWWLSQYQVLGMEEFDQVLEAHD